jgi:HK97 family phage major capsid protein
MNAALNYDPEVKYAPPPLGDMKIDSLPVAAEASSAARKLAEVLNQNNAEFVRAHKEQAAAVGADLSVLDERTRAINANVQAAADEIANLDAELKRAQAAAIARETAATVSDGEDADDPRNAAEWASGFEAWLRGGGPGMSDDDCLAVAKGNKWHDVHEGATVKQMLSPSWNPVAAVSAGGLSTTFGPGAGVWARPQHDTEITKLLVEHSPIRSFARVTNINAGEFVGVIRNSNRDTIEQVLEGASATQQTQKDRYEERRVRPYIYWAKPALTMESIEDSAIDLEAEVMQDVALDCAVDEASLFTVGSGANEPEGYATDTDVGGITSEASGTISHKDLLDLALSLRPVYRANGAYAFSTTAFRLAILDEDGMGRRLWQPSIQAGFPSLYNGWPYFEATEQAAVAASSKSVFFADWGQFYRIVDRRGTRIIRDDITTDGIVILKHSRRFGGRTWKEEAGKALTTKA